MCPGNGNKWGTPGGTVAQRVKADCIWIGTMCVLTQHESESRRNLVASTPHGLEAAPPAPPPRPKRRRSPLVTAQGGSASSSPASVPCKEPELCGRAVERPDPLDSPGTHKPGLVAPRGRRLARVAWIRRPAVRQGARSPTRLPHTTESCCTGCQTPPSLVWHTRRAQWLTSKVAAVRITPPPPKNPHCGPDHSRTAQGRIVGGLEP